MTDIFNNINWAVIAPLLVIDGILIILAFIDWLRTDKTNGPKWLWLPIILFVSIFGPILYFIIGRRQHE